MTNDAVSCSLFHCLLASELFGGAQTDGLRLCHTVAAVTILHTMQRLRHLPDKGLYLSAVLTSVVGRRCTNKTWNATECSDIYVFFFQAEDGIRYDVFLSF